MLDIIIPTYEDLNGLQDTLSSIGKYFDSTKVSITIIDDCSPNLTEEDYTEILKPFLGLCEISFISLKENQGPGYVRQFGFENTQQPYILFLDCGDILNGPLTINSYLELIEENSNISMFTFGLMGQNQHDEFIIINKHNLFHGTIFKRSFLQKYKLKIPIANSYMHEDIPFIMMCGIIADINHEFMHIPSITPIIHLNNPNSLTLKNNCERYAKEMLSGYLENTMWMIDNHPHLEEYFYDYLVRIFVPMYFMIYIDHDYDRIKSYEHDYPILLKFYHYYYKKYDQHDEVLFNSIYYSTIEMLSERFDPTKRLVLDIWKFISKLEKDYTIKDPFENEKE